MYDLINHFAKTVVETIKPEHVTDYEWLLQNVGQASTPDYQERYRRFWAMNPARLGPEFYTTYFSTFTAALSRPPSLSSIAQTLHAASARQNGQKSLQFSFATKLLHMTNQHSPIYDSQVTAFYFFQEPLVQVDLQRRIDNLMSFHSFLAEEYSRVIEGGLLAIAIQEFRVRLKPQRFTDEKIVDSLVWAFVALLRKGAVPKRQITYR